MLWVVRASLYVRGGELTLEDLRGAINRAANENDLPRRWRITVRDIVKHDPLIEKGDDGVYVLRADDTGADV